MVDTGCVQWLPKSPKTKTPLGSHGKTGKTVAAPRFPTDAWRGFFSEEHDILIAPVVTGVLEKAPRTLTLTVL